MSKFGWHERLDLLRLETGVLTLERDRESERERVTTERTELLEKKRDEEEVWLEGVVLVLGAVLLMKRLKRRAKSPALQNTLTDV